MASGGDFLWPDEWASERLDGWVDRSRVPDEAEAIALAARELGAPAERIRLVPVLMREESEVEARINGHDFQFWVECTPRARAAKPYWRVVVDRG